jgi:hypothetical protein
MKPPNTHDHAILPFTLRAVVCASLIGEAVFAQSLDATQPPSAPSRLPLKAEVLLSPKFCATKKRQSIALKDVLNVGKATCEQIYAALIPVFSELQRLEKMPTAGGNTAQITLIPRFVDISTTQQPFLPSSQRKLVIFLEWTVQDSMGHTIWLQTVQGSSEHKAGWAVTAKGVAAMVDAAVGELAQDSVAKISVAPELQKLSP